MCVIHDCDVRDSLVVLGPHSSVCMIHDYDVRDSLVVLSPHVSGLEVINQFRQQE